MFLDCKKNEDLPGKVLAIIKLQAMVTVCADRGGVNFVWRWMMEIIFQGKHSMEDTAESLVSVLNLFKQRYGIENFRQLHLNVTLVDAQGDDVELIDSETSEVFKVFEVCRDSDLVEKRPAPKLQLVVDNT